MLKRFVKLAILILLMLISVVGAAAQTICGLENAPKLLGFNLGMSSSEAQTVVGKDLKIKVKQNGQRTFFQNYIKTPAPDSLRGVRALYLRFLDNRLYQIEVFYENRNDWQTLTDFIANFSASVNFSVSVWQIKQNRAVIDCGAFLVTADKILNPHIELTDEASRAKVEAAR